MKAKAKRTITSVLPVANNRTGQCVGCGACCKLPHPCSFLKYKEDGRSFCAIYTVRPLNCRKYPRTASECLTSDTCGFRFEQLPAPERLPIYRRFPIISSGTLHFYIIACWMNMSAIFKTLKKLFD